MRFLAINLTLAALCLFGPFAREQEALAQVMVQQGSGIGFRNDLKVPVIVQGINNMQRRGQPFVVQPGKTVWENNLPAGIRYYNIYEASQTRILLPNRPVRIQTADQFFAIHTVTQNGKVQVLMDQEKVPVPEK
jgi:hypothetical protein